MNVPNQLTLFRLCLTLPFVAALSVNFPGAKTTALILFLVGSFTDYADGMIARKYQLISDFGRLMDPLVDKILTVSAFICLVALHLLPAWAAIIIVSREFLITGLRLIAASQGKVLAAEKLGKHKTVWQMITIVYFLVMLAIAELGGPDWTKKLKLTVLGDVLIGVTVILTLVSGISYLTKHWDLIGET
jgi:CDP-diacylglycerol---glycerol-3-phosphate 3-phosphatidyltransferase